MTIGTRLGWGLTGLFALFMLGASIAPKLAGAAVATDSLVALGWDPRFVLPIGLMELAFLLLHLYRPTALLGALLMTGLLGGAMASQIRAGQPWLSHALFGLYLGIVLWGGMWLRDPGLRAMLPLRRG